MGTQNVAKTIALGLCLVAVSMINVAAAEPAAAPAPAASPAAGAVEPFITLAYGATIDINTLPVPGKTTVVDFFSEFCGPCHVYSNALEKYIKTHPDVVIRRLDVNRKGTVGIDWSSPLCQQYEIQALPSFVIYDPKGKVLAKGSDASDMLDDWFSGKKK